MQYLEEKGCGYDTGIARVPIVPAAIIFDLHLGDRKARPNREMGYQACLAAKRGRVAEGCVGAGTGATVGNLLGPRWAMKGGLARPIPVLTVTPFLSSPGGVSRQILTRLLFSLLSASLRLCSGLSGRPGLLVESRG